MVSGSVAFEASLNRVVTVLMFGRFALVTIDDAWPQVRRTATEYRLPMHESQMHASRGWTKMADGVCGVVHVRLPVYVCACWPIVVMAAERRQCVARAVRTEVPFRSVAGGVQAP